MTDFIDSGTVYLDLIAGGWDGKVIPANNDFANATVLSTTLPGSITGHTTKDSGWEVGEHSIGVSGNTGQQTQDVIGDQGVWYKFTPTSDGFYKFSFTNVLRDGNTQASFGFLNCLMLHSTSRDDFDYLNDAGMVKTVGSEGASSFGSPGQTDMYVELEAGETYYMKVWSTVATTFTGGGYNGLNSFTCSYNLGWSLASRTGPANDNFANAEVIGATLPDSTTGTTFDAWREEGESLWRNQAQTVWYKFTPPADGVYRIGLPNGTPHTGASSNAYAYVFLYDGTGKTQAYEFDTTNQISDATMDASVDDQIIAFMSGGTDYYIQFVGDANYSSGGKNWRAIDYTIDIDVFPTPTGDLFGSPYVLTGASGTQAFTAAGAIGEPNEPGSAYWNTGTETGASIWFEWTCPTTGWYAFRSEATDDSTTSVEPVYYMTVYTGSTLTGLTRVVRSVAGTQNDQGRLRSPATTCGFHATSGTVYKIQVVNSDPNNAGQDNSLLSWATMPAPVGETTTDALPFAFSRVNNFGHTDTSELPPNVAATLSAHDNWWYTDGRPAKVKWFRFDVPTTMTLDIGGRWVDGLFESGNGYWVPDAGLIVYKGADYASLTVAKQGVTAVDAAACLSGFETTADLGTTEGRFIGLPISGQQYSKMQVNATAGEIVWVAVFALYDADYAGSTEADAPEFEVDMKLGIPAPGNDNMTSVAFNSSAYYMSRSEFGNYLSYARAAQRTGTTVGATADVGEPDHAAIPPTRSVWYVMEAGYFSTPPWTMKFWVESAVDCVMSIYKAPYPYNNFATFTHIASDDDSGPGDQPEITQTLANGTYWIKVDSRTAGTFTLKFQQVAGVSPPANNNFANATVISSLPFAASGTTVDANAEPEEHEAEALGVGPTDSIWYKYVAPADGIVKVWATCDSAYNDGYIYIDCWKGTTLANLVRPVTPPPGLAVGDFGGFFNWGDDYEDVVQEDRAFIVDVVSGQTYYFRVQTESGGSEDFTIHIDTAGVYLDLKPSGTDVGPYSDEMTVYLRLTPGGFTESHGAISDAGAAYVDITPGFTWETQGQEKTDAATAYVNIDVLGGECFSRFHFTGEGEADARWEADADTRWDGDSDVRWTVNIDVQPGCH